MSRPLSIPFKRASNALSTNECFLVLLTITYPPTGETYRVVNNSENIVSRGQTYTAYPFNITLPMATSEEVGVARLEFDNVELILVDMLRAATTPPLVNIEVILASRPDFVEIGILNLALRDVSWDASTVRAQLYNEDILSRKFPRQDYNPNENPGMF